MHPCTNSATIIIIVRFCLFLQRVYAQIFSILQKFQYFQIPMGFSDKNSKIKTNDDSIVITKSDNGRFSIFANSTKTITVKIFIDDILRTEVEESPSNDPTVNLSIIYYPLAERGYRRVRRVERYTFCQSDNLTDNYSSATEIADKIRQQIACSIAPPYKTVSIKKHTPRKLFVLISSKSGNHKSYQKFQNIVEPILKDAGVVYETQKTEHKTHAWELAKSFDIKKWDGIIIMSGDGVVNEFINSLMEREDRKEAIRFPIAPIPSGSSNALAASLCYECNEPFKPFDFIPSMALMAAKPHYMENALMRADFGDNQSKLSFITLLWGLASDTDIETVKWRPTLGPHRFILKAIQNVIRKRKYRGRVSYLPYTGGMPHVPKSQPIKYPRPISNEKRKNLKLGKISQNEEIEEPRDFQHHVEMPAISDPVPSDWTVIEDDFLMLGCTRSSHITSEMIMVPWARISEDCLYLSLLRDTTTSRLDALLLIDEIKKGTHMNRPCSEFIPVHAMRLEPLNPEDGGHLTLDGELLPYGPVQLSITQQKLTLMGRKR